MAKRRSYKHISPTMLDTAVLQVRRGVPLTDVARDMGCHRTSLSTRLRSERGLTVKKIRESSPKEIRQATKGDKSKVRTLQSRNVGRRVTDIMAEIEKHQEAIALLREEAQQLIGGL